MLVEGVCVCGGGGGAGAATCSVSRLPQQGSV